MKLSAVLLLQLLLLRARLSAGWVSPREQGESMILYKNLNPLQGFYLFTAKIMKFEPLDGVEQNLIDFRNVSIEGGDRALNGTVRIVEDMEPQQF